MQTNPNAVPDYHPNQSIIEEGLSRNESQKSIITSGQSLTMGRL